MDMITMYRGKRLPECSNGEIVTALHVSRPSNGIVAPEMFHALLDEAVKREILPDAMWLVNA